jgi:ribonuclease E
MKRDTSNRAVQDRLVDCLKDDKARMEVGKINRFGVLVMTRQRIRPSLQNVTHEACPMCQGSGKVKSPEALVLSVVRRLKAILCREAISEIRVKLAPSIAMGVLNQKRKDLAALEDLYESRIVILADVEIGYGEMTAEIERREEESTEKPAPRQERPHDSEDETVVLSGDAPISFEKALGEEPKSIPVPAAAEIKYDRRDAQRAAIEERERLRALFESAKPEDEEGLIEPSIEPSIDAKHAKGTAGKRRRGRGSKATGNLELQDSRTAAESEHPQQHKVESAPEPPVLSADFLANLAIPTSRPKLMASPKTEVADPPAEVMEAPKKRGRGRPKKSALETPVTIEPLAKAPAGRRATKSADVSKESIPAVPPASKRSPRSKP